MSKNKCKRFILTNKSTIEQDLSQFIFENFSIIKDKYKSDHIEDYSVEELENKLRLSLNAANIKIQSDYSKKITIIESGTFYEQIIWTYGHVFTKESSNFIWMLLD